MSQERTQTDVSARDEPTDRAQRPGGSPRRHFVRHLVEMVIAMVAGMVVLGPIVALTADQLGWSRTLDDPVPSALVMATTMTIGMTVWMRHRGHPWVSTGQMAAAMYLPFAVLLAPYGVGLLSGDALLIGGHVLMLPAMVVAMLVLEDEYTRQVHVPPQPTETDHEH
jgi:hypothetical protein